MGKTETGRLFRFGVYEAEEETGELRKQGRRLRLQGQPFQVLLMLLQRPGEVVTREEIRQRLWPEGTFVDFDHGLNTAINKLRETVGDSASNPRFIETLARRGYRFIAPVEVVEASAIAPELPAVDQSNHLPAELPPSTDPAALPSGALSQILTQPHQLPQPPGGVVRTLFFFIQLMYLCFYVISLARLGEVEMVVGGITHHGWWVIVLLLVTAAVGIPARLYLIAGVLFQAPGMKESFLKIFYGLFVADELWALAPFLLLPQIGFGLALGGTAALLYVPFAQRSLILMGAGLKQNTEFRS
jgi:DNA-binding winged helix-turn-helix (wHTH) protein